MGGKKKKCKMGKTGILRRLYMIRGKMMSNISL